MEAGLEEFKRGACDGVVFDCHCVCLLVGWGLDWKLVMWWCRGCWWFGRSWTRGTVQTGHTHAYTDHLITCGPFSSFLTLLRIHQDKLKV